MRLIPPTLPGLNVPQTPANSVLTPPQAPQAAQFLNNANVTENVVAQALPEVSLKTGPVNHFDRLVEEGAIVRDAMGNPANDRWADTGQRISEPRGWVPGMGPNYAAGGYSAGEGAFTGQNLPRNPAPAPYAPAPPGVPIGQSQGLLPYTGPGTEVNSSTLPSNQPNPADPTTPEFILADGMADQGWFPAATGETDEGWFPAATQTSAARNGFIPVQGFRSTGGPGSQQADLIQARFPEVRTSSTQGFPSPWQQGGANYREAQNGQAALVAGRFPDAQGRWEGYDPEYGTGTGGGRSILVDAEFPAGEALGNLVVGGDVTGFARAPVIASISSEFLPGGRVNPVDGGFRAHNGVDFAAQGGTPIYPAAPGTVTQVAYQPGGAGNYVIVDHGNGLETKYFHMEAPSTYRQGDTVDPSTAIGFVGTTGNSTGNHLHLEAWENGTPVDPLPLVVGALPPEQQVEFLTDYDIRSQQRVLKATGFYQGEVDGDNGPMTQAATRAFIDAARNAGVDF